MSPRSLLDKAMAHRCCVRSGHWPRGLALARTVLEYGSVDVKSVKGGYEGLALRRVLLVLLEKEIGTETDGARQTATTTVCDGDASVSMHVHVLCPTCARWWIVAQTTGVACAGAHLP